MEHRVEWVRNNLPMGGCEEGWSSKGEWQAADRIGQSRTTVARTSHIKRAGTSIQENRSRIGICVSVRARRIVSGKSS